MFKGKVVKNESVDPNYKIKFSFESDDLVIHDGEAVFTRKSPLPEIIFDDHTYNILRMHDAYEQNVKKIELELGKTVIEHIISNTSDLNNLWVNKSYILNKTSFEPDEVQKKMFINNSSKPKK